MTRLDFRKRAHFCSGMFVLLACLTCLPRAAQVSSCARLLSSRLQPPLMPLKKSVCGGGEGGRDVLPFFHTPHHSHPRFSFHILQIIRVGAAWPLFKMPQHLHCFLGDVRDRNDVLHWKINPSVRCHCY